MSEWQPIETAPKGPIILGCLVCDDMHHFVLVQWDEDEWRDNCGLGCNPDYWRPLPEPPAGEQVERIGEQGRTA